MSCEYESEVWVTFYMRSNHLHQVVDKTLAPSMFFSVKTKIRNTTILILLHSYLYNYNQGQYFPFKYFQTYPFQKLFSTYSGSWINTQFHFWNFFVNFFHEVNHKINKFMAIHLFGMEIGNQEANVVSLEYNSHHITFFCWGVLKLCSNVLDRMVCLPQFSFSEVSQNSLLVASWSL